MARIRSIKPEYWEDEKLARWLTRDQRLFYIGLWNQCDDQGRFVANPRKLLGAVFPFDDDITEDAVRETLNVLAVYSRVTLYESSGCIYGVIRKWHEHQHPNRPRPSQLPAPPRDMRSVYITAGGSVTHTAPGTAHNTAHDTAGGEGRGGVVGKGSSPSLDASKSEGMARSAAPSRAADLLEGFAEFWEAYPRRAGTRGRKAAVNAWHARRREKIPAGVMTEAAERYAAFCDAEELTGTGKVLRASTFLNDPDNFENQWSLPGRNGKPAGLSPAAQRVLDELHDEDLRRKRGQK